MPKKLKKAKAPQKPKANGHSKIISSISTKQILIILTIIIVIGGIIGIIVYFTTFYSSNSSPPQPPQPQPAGKIIGTWSGKIGCGDNFFNLISLSSVIPQDYNPNDLHTFFSENNYITGFYDSSMSSGNVKYILSIGGNKASSSGWTTFLTALNDSTNNYQNLLNFVSACKCRGVVGIDLDLEGTAETMISMINNILTQIRNIDNTFIIMLTILLGSPQTFAGLLTNPNNYDYLSLMLYAYGMYQAGGDGAGCDWDGWAELFLSKGTAGCTTPLKESSSAYAESANLSYVVPSKVLLGLIIDVCDPIGTMNCIRLNQTIKTRADQLINQYGGGGTMIWVVPGWEQKDNISLLNTLGYNIDPSKCGGTMNCSNKYPCTSTNSCGATKCGTFICGATDAQCAACAPGGTSAGQWPCTVEGACQDLSKVPKC